MSKIAEEKANSFREMPTNWYEKMVFTKAYDQSAKDLIARIREQIQIWMPEGNDEHIVGERTAFNSVKHLLSELEYEYGKI